MNSQKILKIFAFYLLIVFFTGCAGTPIKFGGTHPNFDNTNVDFSKGKEIVSTASGFQLLLFIPININSRHEQAFQQLIGMAGRDYITDIKIEESWVYAFVGTVYTTTIKAMSYPRKTQEVPQASSAPVPAPIPEVSAPSLTPAPTVPAPTTEPEQDEVVNEGQKDQLEPVQ